MVIDPLNTDKLFSEDTLKQFVKANIAKGNIIKEDDYLITSLGFINILGKKQLIGWFINDYDNKWIKKLTYLNNNISEDGKLKDDTLINSFEKMVKDNIFDKYYKLFNDWFRL